MKNVYLHLIFSGYAGVKNLEYTKRHLCVTSKGDSQLLVGPDLLFQLPVCKDKGNAKVYCHGFLSTKF